MVGLCPWIPAFLSFGIRSFWICGLLIHETPVLVILMSSQGELPIESIQTDTISGSVWVLAADMMEGGHPTVLGVYDNEQAAREHEQAIRANHGCTVTDDGAYTHVIASFWTYEMEIQSEFDSNSEGLS